MCGIAGFRSIGAYGAPDSLRRITRAMTGALVHRGPDDADLWIDPDAGLALGHRRLAIIDLSAAGRQPMASACGRFVIRVWSLIVDVIKTQPGVIESQPGIPGENR